MLIGLNDTKSLIIILVQDSLDTGRFTGSRITKEQTVVRLSPLYKCLCIINELFLGDLISYQIIDLHMCDPCDRLDLHLSLLIVTDTECLMETKLANTEIFIEGYHIIHKFFGCGGCCQGFAHLTDTVTDPGIKELAVLIRCLVITDHPAAYSSEHFIKDRDVKIIQFLENLEIIFCQVVNAALDRSSYLACHTESVLMIYQKEGKICMPDISGKTVHSCQLHQPVDTFEKLVFSCLECFFICFIKINKFCHIVQYLTV